MKVVNYLDVTQNLNDGSYKPYHKPNNEILYITKESNHLPSISRQLPISIENRLSNLSSSEKVFNELAGVYQEALNKRSYRHQINRLQRPIGRITTESEKSFGLIRSHHRR